MKANPGQLAKFFALLCVAALAFTVILYFQQPTAKMIKTSALITDVETEESTDAEGLVQTDHRYFVDYTVNGVEYKRIPLNYSDSSTAVGRRVEIYYDPDDPASIRTDSKNMILYTGIVSGASLIACVFFALKARRRKD